MKNIFKVLGIIAIVAVIGFSMVACDSNDDGDDGGNGGTLIVTDIPAIYNGKYAGFEASGDVFLGGCQSINLSTGLVTLVKISNSKVSLPMWKADSNTSVAKYSGNDTITQNVNTNEYLSLGISDKPAITWENEADLIAAIEFSSITFNKKKYFPIFASKMQICALIQLTVKSYLYRGAKHGKTGHKRKYWQSVA